jgi:hypothetical protein
VRNGVHFSRAQRRVKEEGAPADAEAPVCDMSETGCVRFVCGRSQKSRGVAGAVRQRYIAALQAADNHDIGPLLAFARS